MHVYKGWYTVLSCTILVKLTSAFEMRRVGSRGLILFKKSTFEIDDKNQPPFLFPFVSTFITYDYQAFKTDFKTNSILTFIPRLYQPFIEHDIMNCINCTTIRSIKFHDYLCLP